MPVPPLNNDVLSVVMECLDPATTKGLRSLHACLLVSNAYLDAAARAAVTVPLGIFHKDADPRSMQHPPGDCTTGLGALLRRLTEASSAADRRRAERWGYYLQPVRRLVLCSRSFRDAAWDVTAVAPWLSRIEDVVIDFHDGHSRDDGWLGWLRTRWDAGVGPETVTLCRASVVMARAVLAHQAIRRLTIEGPHSEKYLTDVLDGVGHGLESIKLGDKSPFATEKARGLIRYAREHAGTLRTIELDVIDYGMHIPDGLPITSMTAKHFSASERELNLPGARETLRELDLRIADYMGVAHPDVFRSLPLLVNCSTLRIGCTKFDRAHLAQALPAMTWLRKLEVRYGGEENFDLPALLGSLVNLEELGLIFAHVHGSGAFIEIDELIAPMTRLHSLRLQMGAKESVAYRVSLSPRFTSLRLESGVLVMDEVSMMGQRLDQLETLVVESGYPVEERSGLDYTERLITILGDKAVAPRLEELRIRSLQGKNATVKHYNPKHWQITLNETYSAEERLLNDRTEGKFED
ncbi:hypothetical protein HK101_011714 [Irineochytrium annulatum]|nr:hypothetical protein HK101_011714 [Irineochytrium annulatum]